MIPSRYDLLRSLLLHTAFVSGCAVLAPSCSVALAVDEYQCERDADCKARGDDFKNTVCSDQRVCVTAKDDVDPRFACADEEPASPDTSREVELEIRYTDFTSGTAPSDIAVRLCATTDPTCENPRDTLDGDAAPSELGAGFVLPSADGVVTGFAEYGFEGFLEVATTTYSQTLRYTSPPLRGDTLLEQILLRPAEIDYFAGLLGGSYQRDTHGLVFVLAQDCDRQPLAGVRFTVDTADDETIPFFVINTTPSTNATKTDALGRAGFLNVPDGIALFTAEWEDTGEYIGSTSVIVRKGAATTVAVLPSP